LIDVDRTPGAERDRADVDVEDAPAFLAAILSQKAGVRLRGVERRLVLTTIAHEAKAREAQDHHRPGRRLGDGAG
jgi:hypothetical protein